jgi:DNA-binding NarL/FixJ family response regulator
VFTISGDAEDKKKAMAAGATGYFVKPKEFETLVRLTESFGRFRFDDFDKNDDLT